MSRDEMGVYTGSCDILEVVVACVRLHLSNPVLWVLAYAIRMPDIEVKSNPLRVDPVNKFKILAKGFDQEFRFGLDQQIDLELLGRLLGLALLAGTALADIALYGRRRGA